MDEITQKFQVPTERDEYIREIMKVVYSALKENGYNPINQIVGYLLSDDPTYITSHCNARTLIRKLDRDEVLQSLVRFYVQNEKK